DANGNMFAWWLPEDGTRGDAVLTGSHLDSVPGGGAFDGPLGIVSAFAAVDRLREQGVRPGRPIGIGAFAEEEGARFGVACLGSRLLAGAI
ncbi:M20/M25/M40 family metallo-hydrolase, partial [Micromonospora aurantiaca]|nr:M20/M25/M40 family metallo-hydrolase [Micromonospora aurantiaca]